MAIQKTYLTLHSQYNTGPVDKRIFGGFIEHLGRCIYGGIYDSESPLSDTDGFRSDVFEALKQLRFTVMRYPGGNFTSGYHWQDGVGPKESRPKVRELAWKSIETNQFGTDEFVKFSRKLGWEPMLAVNLGTGTPEEARNWVEYCNSPAGSRYADMRKANGNIEPHGVKLWCLGNEMDGFWQMGHVPALEYAIRAQQAAKLMRDVNDDLELVVCGSASTVMPTYMEWDRQVLEYLEQRVDYISLHCYCENRACDTADFLASVCLIDKQIEQIDAVCRFVQAKKRSPKRVLLCFDEWNVWYREQNMGNWTQSPHLLEEVYNLEDALVVAGVLNSFIRHADVLKIANLAQAVNVIAPIMTRHDGLFKQTIFYPFNMFAKRREGISLVPKIEGPHYESKSHGRVSYLDASAIMDENILNLFLINRNLDKEMDVEIYLCDRGIKGVVNAEILTGNDPKTKNSFDCPNAIKATEYFCIDIKNDKATVSMPPLSLIAATFSIE